MNWKYKISNNILYFCFLGFLLFVILFFLIFVNLSTFICGVNTVTDIDGNIYSTVKIGNQCWMTENMNVGKMIADPSIMPSDNYKIEKWCNGADGKAHTVSGDCDIYGGLYTWDEATNPYGNNSGDICPKGWHIPTDTEQYNLENYLTTDNCDATRSNVWDCSPAGKYMSYFTSDGTNSSGFSALLAGYIRTDRTFYNRGIFTSFWSSSTVGEDALSRFLYSDKEGIHRNRHSKSHGFSVRCLKN